MTSFKQLGGIGTNSANEFFETMIMMTALGATQGLVKDLTQDIENEALKEATQGAMNVIIYGSIAFLISVEEEVLDFILNKSKSAAAAIILSGKAVGNKIHNKFKGKKGRLAKMGADVGSSIRNDSAQIANVLSNYAIADTTAKGAKNSNANVLGNAQDQKNYAINKDNHNLNIAKAMQQSMHSSNILKLVSSKFTDQDKSMLRKITGNPDFNSEDIADLNKVRDFMFTKDSNGDNISLSESFVSLINTMGYFHKSGK